MAEESARERPAARLLRESPLFDHEWYAGFVGRPLDRAAAVRHYLDEGAAAGWTPHPLFDPATFRDALGAERVGDREPLVVYLRRRAFRQPTHPLFDAEAYLDAIPEAADHPGGPVAHWCEVGRSRGVPASSWFRTDDLLGWLADQRRTWAGRRGEPEPQVDWRGAAARDADPGLVSVVVTGSSGGQATLGTVRGVLDEAARAGDRVEVVVVAGASGVAGASAVAAAAEALPGVTLSAHAAPLGRALARNLGVARAGGATVVFLDAGTEVQPGWLAPLRAALDADDVLAAQPLLTSPGGSVRSAGWAFPGRGGLPHALLEGFHADDAGALARASPHAVSGAALAVRRADAVRVEGFDPLLQQVLEDVDLCLRLRRLRPGRMAVAPDARVTLPDADAPDRAQAAADRRAFLERWHQDLPADDADLWALAGYTVHDHAPGSRDPEDGDFWRPRPLLSRRGRAALQVAEAAPSLRWAVKNPAPHGPAGERWGDTHFARQLATALRGLGQEVVIDHREEFERPSGRFDDVVVVLRGLTEHRPAWGPVTLLWVISHPERVTRDEAARHDRVLAASVPWARARSAEWGVRVDPLLQATDPSVFHPDRAEADSGHRVLFVGNSRMRERPLVRDAVEAGADLSVYGSNWEGLIPSSLVVAPFLPNAEVGAAYRSAGVVLNDHWAEMREEGFLSNRLFDAVAAGARVVTDDVAGLREVFGSSVQVARGPADLRRLLGAADLDAVFGDDAARREAAARVHAEHSFASRARTLLDAALEVRATARRR